MEENNHIEKQKLDEIKILLKNGQINYDEAKEMAEEPLRKMNEKVVQIAKSFGRNPNLITFAGFMR